MREAPSPGDTPCPVRRRMDHEQPTVLLTRTTGPLPSGAATRERDVPVAERHSTTTGDGCRFVHGAWKQHAHPCREGWRDFRVHAEVWWPERHPHDALRVP